MAKQYAIYSEKPNAFEAFGISVLPQSGTSDRGFRKLPGDSRFAVWNFFKPRRARVINQKLLKNTVDVLVNPPPLTIFGPRTTGGGV